MHYEEAQQERASGGENSQTLGWKLSHLKEENKVMLQERERLEQRRLQTGRGERWRRVWASEIEGKTR